MADNLAKIQLIGEFVAHARSSKGTALDLEIAQLLLAEQRRSPPPAVEGGSADWPFDATLCAKEVLESLGIGSDESLEPGDRRRDRIARIIGKYIDAGARTPTPSAGEKPEGDARPLLSHPADVEDARKENEK